MLSKMDELGFGNCTNNRACEAECPKNVSISNKMCIRDRSESLRNDGRIWVPKKLEDAKKLQDGTLQGKDIPEEDRDYYLERRYPAFGNLVPREDV